jgi:hypothetical protein
MGVNRNGLTIVIVTLLVALFCEIDFIYAVESDINCLRAVQESLEDPLNSLNSSWNFNNNTEGYICRFAGIDCWHPDESRVLNLRLSGMGLRGEFPQGIANCTTMTGLDLSGNNLSGPIPSNISHIVKYLTLLDLSGNNFSGEIPASISNILFLNTLNLNNNQLSGQIPGELGQLHRLKTFSVANNRLSGQVPRFVNGSITAGSYANNLDLCGEPLPACQGVKKKTRLGVILGAGIGGVILGALAIFVCMLFFVRRRRAVSRKKDDDPDGNKWAKSIKGAKAIKLSVFEKTITRMSLSDLMKATGDFNKSNIISKGSTGTIYRAVLENGTSLMVKRLQDTQHPEKEFSSEMATLAHLKHRNLVPLLGFCVAKKERLLVYKYMPNGTLYDKLHLLKDDEKPMDWPSRLKIGIYAAKGFAFLHHSCNPRIIHRNVSSKCILLDADFDPKISDFGLARLMNPVDTHLSTFVNGEFGDLGYVAPEYARTLVATPKGDVYSFGVVLLELVTGETPTRVRKAGENFKGSLVEWISQLSEESKLVEAIDECLTGQGYDNETFQFLKVACTCVVPAHKERPTMFEVYQLLRSIGEQYHFTADDDALVMSETNGADDAGELIVARELKVIVKK